MGMLRSTTGCLTCRSRRVKCDETLPICGNCHKSNRACRREERSRIRFQKAKRVPPSPVASLSPSSSRSLGASTSPLNNEAFLNLITHPVQPAVSSPELVSRTPSKPLTRHEASLVQYYTEHLGRWLDCTDAARQFTLSIPALCTRCPVLLEAIVTFAARHRRGPNDTEAASLAHERCIAMLIVLLGSDNVADDDVLLSAIVILRVFEQLTAQGNGTDQERHLAGCSALLRTSQGSSVDPAAPGLRDAAFWVYLRQCLYNACINQQAPNVDFSLTLMSIQNVLACESLGRSSVDVLKVETAWANTMTWICATTVNFCFGPQTHPLETKSRMDKWLELHSTVDNWAESRPRSFNPIWEGAGDGQDDNDRWSPFPQFFFAADWHVVAFGFYQLACILLIMYKPTPRFAIRSAGAVRLRKEDAQILEHARALCGSCRSHPDNVPARITLCHSVFLWGGLISDPCERAGVLQLLQELETDHAWPTTWIVSSLNEEWGTI